MGQMMKLINNLLSATATAATSEAIVLGVKAGLDPHVMIDVINAGSGRNTATRGQVPARDPAAQLRFRLRRSASCQGREALHRRGRGAAGADVGRQRGEAALALRPRRKAAPIRTSPSSSRISRNGPASPSAASRRNGNGRVRYEVSRHRPRRRATQYPLICVRGTVVPSLGARRTGCSAGACPWARRRRDPGAEHDEREASPRVRDQAR